MLYSHYSYPSFPQPLYLEDEEWATNLGEESGDESDYNEGVEPVISSSPLLILPLYATLSPDQQSRVYYYSDKLYYYYFITGLFMSI